MLRRVYTRSSGLNAARRIHTSQLAYAQKVKPGTRRGLGPPAVKEKVKEEVVADEPYGEHYILLPKPRLSNGLQSNGMNSVSSCSRDRSILKSSRTPYSLLQTRHISRLLEITLLLTALIPPEAPFCRMFPSPSLPYRARTSTNISIGSALQPPNPGWTLHAISPSPLSLQNPITGASNLAGQSMFIKTTAQVTISPWTIRTMQRSHSISKPCLTATLILSWLALYPKMPGTPGYPPGCWVNPRIRNTLSPSETPICIA